MSAAQEPGSPFPGMGPFLEDPALWADFHRRLVATPAESLGSLVAGRYGVVTGSRRYTAAAAEGSEEH